LVGEKMELNICYLYYDLLNVYGDRGNILILKEIIENNDIDCNIKYVSIGDDFRPDEYDILFMGGGQDYEQITVGEDIIKNKKELLNNYIENNGPGLYICGAYQLLGKKYIAADGRQIDGAGILDIYTEKGTRRFINDVVLESEFFKTKLVGFENHSGRTFINNYQPLGKIMYGNGNNGEDGNEGLIYKSTVCTYLHGCCLSKNPEISKFMIEKAINRRYGETVEISIDTKLSNAAKKDIINRYSK
jgi:CobQ-like glutamine amidotransferase family enzyme